MLALATWSPRCHKRPVRVLAQEELRANTQLQICKKYLIEKYTFLQRSPRNRTCATFKNVNEEIEDVRMTRATACLLDSFYHLDKMFKTR